jgi:hypothetical protein
MTTTYTKWPLNVPFGRIYVDKMVIKYQHLPLQGLPKLSEIGIFGLKVYHLATLEVTHKFLQRKTIQSFTNASLFYCLNGLSEVHCQLRRLSR